MAVSKDEAVRRSRLREPSWFETPAAQAPHREGVVRDGPAGLLTMRGWGCGTGANDPAAPHRAAKCACAIARGCVPTRQSHKDLLICALP